MNWHAPLVMAHSILGVDRILYAVDYPFEEHQPAVSNMDTAPLSESDKEKIYHAMLLDPNAASVCSPEEIREMTAEMFKANEKWLKWFNE